MTGSLGSLNLTPELTEALEKACGAVYELERIHVPAVTPSAASNSPGKQPTVVLVNASILGLAMTVDTDDALRLYKLPFSYAGNASFHVHWTKSTNTDDSGKTVRWRISYTVFDGKTEEVTGAPATVEYEDTYVDSGTTTRYVYCTPDILVDGEFESAHYVGVKIEAISPSAGTPLTDPVVVSLDLVYDQQIHL